MWDLPPASITVCMSVIFSHRKIQESGGRTLMYTAAAFLLMAVMIPYMPENIPEGRPPCAACFFFTCASGLQYHWLPPLSQLPRPDAFSRGMGHPVDDGSLLRPLPPGSGLYHQFSGNIHHYRAVRVSALYGNSFWQRKIAM